MNTDLSFRNSVPQSNSAITWLSYAEINFFKVLNRVIADDAFILTKVPVSEVMKHSSVSEKEIARGFGDQVFDFVLFDKTNFSVLCVIELDDRPQSLRKLSKEFSFKKICGDAGVGLIEIPAMCGYDLVRIKHKISSTINKFGHNPSQNLLCSIS